MPRLHPLGLYPFSSGILYTPQLDLFGDRLPNRRAGSLGLPLAQPFAPCFQYFIGFSSEPSRPDPRREKRLLIQPIRSYRGITNRPFIRDHFRDPSPTRGNGGLGHRKERPAVRPFLFRKSSGLSGLCQQTRSQLLAPWKLAGILPPGVLIKTHGRHAASGLDPFGPIPFKTIPGPPKINLVGKAPFLRGFLRDRDPHVPSGAKGQRAGNDGSITHRISRHEFFPFPCPLSMEDVLTPSSSRSVSATSQKHFFPWEPGLGPGGPYHHFLLLLVQKKEFRPDHCLGILPDHAQPRIRDRSSRRSKLGRP